MKLELEEEVKGLRVRSVQRDAIWAAGRGRVYRKSNSQNWSKVANPAEGVLNRLFGGNSLYRRLLRRGVHDIFQLDSGTVLVVANGKFFRFTPEGGLKEVHELRKGKRPLRQGITYDGSVVYYGEYWTNSGREEVRVYKSLDEGETWEPVYVFSEGSVRHIHAVQYDKFEDLIWVTTGDEDEECRIACFEDNFSSFRTIGSGSQTWRTAGLAFTENSVFWGTDNPKGDNYILRWDRRDEELEKVGSAIGPIYYCTRVGNYLIFSSAVERGEGDQDGYARIYGLSPEGELEELYRLKKDFYHPILFGYGWFEFPHGNLDDNRFWIGTKGLVGGRRSFLFRLKD